MRTPGKKGKVGKKEGGRGIRCEKRNSSELQLKNLGQGPGIASERRLKKGGGGN